MKILVNIGSIPIGAVNRSENIREGYIFLMLHSFGNCGIYKKYERFCMASTKEKTNPTSSDVKIKLIMAAINKPRTISYLSRLINSSARDTRRIIARIRKHHPIYAFTDGTGYKYASKREARKLISFERNIIKNHQKNLKVLTDYVGE